MKGTFKERVNWLVMHGVVRAGANVSARRGDPQARFFADPAVRADPVPFFEALRAQGRLVRARVAFLTVDHALAHELLRSDDFRVINAGGGLPAPLRWPRLMRPAPVRGLRLSRRAWRPAARR
jgi:hypothetical protein